MLQEISGLSNADPIYRYLGIVDRFLGEHDWTDTLQNLSLEELIASTRGLFFRGKTLLNIEESFFDDFERFLQENSEPVIAEIVTKLRQRKGEEGMDLGGMRATIMFIVVNLDYLKERYLEGRKGRFRQITTGWKPSMES
jgi:hypothetical protein